MTDTTAKRLEKYLFEGDLMPYDNRTYQTLRHLLVYLDMQERRLNSLGVPPIVIEDEFLASVLTGDDN